MRGRPSWTPITLEACYFPFFDALDFSLDFALVFSFDDVSAFAGSFAAYWPASSRCL